jgi:organic hydroperoxide reductase OsmC/OhrA
VSLRQCFYSKPFFIEPSVANAACFLGALQLVAKNKNAKLSDDVKIKVAVSIGMSAYIAHHLNFT